MKYFTFLLTESQLHCSVVHPQARLAPHLMEAMDQELLRVSRTWNNLPHHLAQAHDSSPTRITKPDQTHITKLMCITNRFTEYILTCNPTLVSFEYLQNTSRIAQFSSNCFIYFKHITISSISLERPSKALVLNLGVNVPFSGSIYSSQIKKAHKDVLTVVTYRYILIPICPLMALDKFGSETRIGPFSCEPTQFLLYSFNHLY